MPQGCGTWPAAWEVNEENWPGQGEVDIVRAACLILVAAMC